MELTPNDIRNFEFPTQLRGYDKDAVDQFCEKCAQALELVKQESVKLTMELESVKGQLDGLRQFEDAIKSAAIDARQNANQTVTTAQKEAEKILTEAREQAEATIVSNQHKLESINTQIKRLAETRASYLEQLQSMMQNHLMMVDAIEKNEALAISPDEDIAVTDSSEVDGSLRRNVADVDPGDNEEDDEVSEKGELSDSSDIPAVDSDTEKLKEVLAEDNPPAAQTEAQIDPELAAALQNYKKDVTNDQTAQNTKAAQAQPAAQAAPPVPPVPPVPPAPKQDEVVETTARAEDVPEGFITTNNELAAQPQPNNTIEENSVDLANELDNVVATFEEEMDKAAKS